MAEAYTRQMSPEEITDAALALLAVVLEEGHALSPQNADLKSSQVAFVYRHGANVCHLGYDMVFLLKAKRHVAATMLIRPMIESMFNVSASYKLPHFHIEKMIGELEKSLDWLKGEFPNPHASIVAAINDSQAELDDLVKNFSKGISANRWKSIKGIAIAAKVERFYKKDFAYFCEYTHCNISSMMRQEEGIGLGNALQTGTMTVLVTASILCGVLTVKDRVKKLQEAKELAIELTDAMNSGALNALDAKEAIP